MIPRNRVMVLLLDAPNDDLLRRWMAEGRLPHLQALQQRAAHMVIQSEKRFSNEHSWIPVLTGRRPDSWGHWLDQWDPRRYKYDEASIFDWLRAPVFYALGEPCRVAAFDLTAPIVEGVNGVQVAGWATELNECFPQSQPPGLLADLLARFGPDPKADDARPVKNALSGRQGVSYSIPSLYQPALMRAHAQGQIRSVERRTAACRHLLGQESWGLFIAAYSELHTAGHLLWHLSQPHPLEAVRDGEDDPLLAVYQAVDASIGELLSAMDEGVFVLVCTVDAMAVDCLENVRAALLPEFMYRWNFPGRAALAPGVAGTPPPAPRHDHAQHWKHEIWKLRTPEGERDLESPASQEARGDPLSWCPANWYAPLWPSMRAFAMPSVADGYIRLNVRGREAHGLVNPQDYDAVCDELTRDLSRLVDARSGQPLVREIVRVRRDAMDPDPAKPPADLIVVVHDRNPVDVVDSPRAGRIGPLPYFRSGSHQAHAAVVENRMFLAGPGVAPGPAMQIAALEDIPATILALLGLPVPPSFDGTARFQ